MVTMPQMVKITLINTSVVSTSLHDITTRLERLTAVWVELNKMATSSKKPRSVYKQTVIPGFKGRESCEGIVTIKYTLVGS